MGACREYYKSSLKNIDIFFYIRNCWASFHVEVTISAMCWRFRLVNFVRYSLQFYGSRVGIFIKRGPGC